MLLGIAQGLSPFATAIFTPGTRGIVLGRKNIIITSTSTEPTLPAANPNSLISPVHIDDLIGQLSAPPTSTVAAAEAAIGLAILVIYLRIRGTILAQYIHFMKGQRNGNEIHKRIRLADVLHVAVGNHHIFTFTSSRGTNYSYSYHAFGSA